MYRSYSDNQPARSFDSVACAMALEIRNQKNNRSIRVRVFWSGPEDGSGSYQLGVEFEDTESGFWGDDYSLKPVQIASANDKKNQ